MLFDCSACLLELPKSRVLLLSNKTHPHVFWCNCHLMWWPLHERASSWASLSSSAVLPNLNNLLYGLSIFGEVADLALESRNNRRGERSDPKSVSPFLLSLPSPSCWAYAPLLQEGLGEEGAETGFLLFPSSSPSLELKKYGKSFAHSGR